MKKSTLVYPSLQALLKKPIHFLAFGLGSGLIRPAPGTWGSLLGALLLLPFLSQVFDKTLFNLLFIAATFALGCHFCGHFGFVAVSIASLLAFRLFDIWKPQPIGWLDRNTAGGFGIMIDDLLAALYALLLLWSSYFFYA